MLSLLLLVTTAEAKKKPAPPPPPPVGWYIEGAGPCYAPPAWDSLDLSTRRAKRQEALEAMRAQWSGQKEEGVSFDSGLIDTVETILLGTPEKIEAVTAQNQAWCVAFRKGGDVQAWEEAVRGLPAKLTAGECLTPFYYTKFDYLDIGKAWQSGTPVCKGDKIHIFASLKDKYRVKEDGAWITVTGDGTPATGGDFPCNTEGCVVGMLIGRFTTENGVETVFPIGADIVYEAPAHGTIHTMINDTVWYDNRYFKGASIEDRTAITFEPAK